MNLGALRKAFNDLANKPLLVFPPAPVKLAPGSVESVPLRCFDSTYTMTTGPK